MTISKNFLLHISWIHSISIHSWFFILRNNFLWSFPFNHWHIHSILWWIDRIIVKRPIISWEFWVTKESIIFSTNLNDLLDLVLYRIFLWFLFLLQIVLSVWIIHHLISIISHFVSIFSILLSHQFVLLCAHLHSILAHKLIRIILTHHLLLL